MKKVLESGHNSGDSEREPSNGNMTSTIDPPNSKGVDVQPIPTQGNNNNETQPECDETLININSEQKDRNEYERITPDLLRNPDDVSK